MEAASSEAGASKIHDFLLHMQLGPWCKQLPLPSFAVSTKSSNPFLKHLHFHALKLWQFQWPLKMAPKKLKTLDQMRHCDVLAVLDAIQSFLSCYPHLHGLWKGTSIWRYSGYIDASCFNMLQEECKAWRLGAAYLFATDASKICFHILQCEFQ